jgi:membrane protease subunit HflK
LALSSCSGSAPRWFTAWLPAGKGRVTTFGAYSHTIDSGVSLTLPWPIQAVTVEDVTSIRRNSIPEGDGERLMLTGDQNLVNLTYLVRWNIKDLKLYTFQLAEPDATVKEVAEAAMRQSIAEVSLNDAMGSGRASIEADVRERMQRLDAYRSGVKIQGVEIKKTDPPAKVVDAFKEVLSRPAGRAERHQPRRSLCAADHQRAQGEATAFDKVYEQYRLAPEVTRRAAHVLRHDGARAEQDGQGDRGDQGVVPCMPLPGIKQTPPADTAANGGERR